MLGIFLGVTLGLEALNFTDNLQWVLFYTILYLICNYIEDFVGVCQCKTEKPM